MDLKDITKNQHFVSQVEQRLNSINKFDKEKNQKIHSFSLVDRESHNIKIDSKNGFKISNTLSLNDVFSFDVLGKEAERYNFEKLFYKYESDIKTNTESLILKLSTPNSDLKSETIDLFTSKFLNFVRNPYSIKKVLNTFPQLRSVQPTDPIHHRNFKRVIDGVKPHQRYLCNELGVTEHEYASWLAMIFLLLTPFKKGDLNFLEQTIKGIYENKNLFIMILVYTYKNKSCLLSDRGYSIPLPENEHMAWDFNLYSNGFIRHLFGNLDSLAPKHSPKHLLEKFKELPRSISVYHFENDLPALAQYNRNVVYQCHNNVFNSSDECFGL